MASSNPSFMVSIRLMTYNHAAYIEDALKGIDLQKTNFPVELIIGDDFSPDNTLEKIASYAFTNSNLTVKVLQRHQGDSYHKKRLQKGRLYNFLNIIENCSGKYIALLDGDDYWTDPLKLQLQVDFLEKNIEYSGCFHNTNILYENSESKEIKSWRSYEREIFLLEDTISKRALFHSSAFLFRNNSTLPNWFCKIQSGDMALFSIVASRGNLFRIDRSMSIYRKNDLGITTTISKNSYHTNRIKLLEYLEQYLEGKVANKIMEIKQFHLKQLHKNTESISFFKRLKMFLKNR